MLPAQVEAYPGLGLGVGAVVVVLQEHGEHNQRGRDARAAFGRILVERDVVLVVDEYVALVGEAGVERVGGHERGPGLRIDGR